MRILLRETSLAIALVFLVVGVSAQGTSAQAPGYAEILAPTPGSPLQGLVTISGSANHPAMLSYDLAFAFPQDPTGTWFPILEESTTAVVRDRLALWDTTTLTDGTYDLRLQVHLRDGTVLEAVSAGLRIRNRTPIETPTLAPVPLGPSPQPTPSPVPAATLGAAPDHPAPSGQLVAQSWLVGALGALAALGLLGGYAQLRTRRRRNPPSPASPPTRRRRTRHRGTL
jgi:hypothetical protein